MDESFVEARHSLGLRDRSRRDKRTSLSLALDTVVDGHHVAIGGCLYSRTPLAALMELLRKRRTGLTLSRSLMCYEGEMFLASGASTHLMTSWMGIGLPWGISRILRKYVESGRAEFEEWSHLADGGRTSFPHYVVDAVVEAPFGAYPHELYGRYDADFDHFDQYVRLTKEEGGLEQYLDRYVFGVADHAGFLETFGAATLRAASARAGEILR